MQRTEILMPAAYKGDGYGVSAYITGMETDAEYNGIKIYIDESAKSDVLREVDNLAFSTVASFGGLDNDTYYRVYAEFIKTVDGESETISFYCDMVAQEYKPHNAHTSGFVGGALSSNIGVRMMSMSKNESTPNSNTGGVVDVPYYQPLNAVAIKSQFDYEHDEQHGTCCACAAVSAMERFRYKKEMDTFGYVKSYEQYSIAYVYGSDGGNIDWGMYNDDVLNALVNKGSPRWELLIKDNSPYGYYDNRLKSDAISIYNVAYANSEIRTNALNQRISSYSRISSFYNTTDIKSALSSGRIVYMSFDPIPSVVYTASPDTNGVIPDIELTSTLSYRSGGTVSNGESSDSGDTGTDNSYGFPCTEGGHAVLIIGHTTINGKLHWIVQNSWGYGWGNDGYGYMPWDWGQGISTFNTYCYSLYDNSVPTGNPEKVKDVYFNGTVGAENNMSLAWSDNTNTDVKYLVYAAVNRSESSYQPDPYEWYYKGETTNKSISFAMTTTSKCRYKIIAMNGSKLMSKAVHFVETPPNIVIIEGAVIQKLGTRAFDVSWTVSLPEDYYYYRDYAVKVQGSSSYSGTYYDKSEYIPWQSGVTTYSVTTEPFENYQKYYLRIYGLTSNTRFGSYNNYSDNKIDVTVIFSWSEAEENAFRNKGHTSVWKKQRWRDFTDYVIEMVGEKGNLEDELSEDCIDYCIEQFGKILYTYNDFQFEILNYHSPNYTEQELGAPEFNLVGFLIKYLNPSVTENEIPVVSSGDPVKGQYFITLSNKLNEII